MSEVDFDPFIRPRVGEIAAAREEAARRGGEDFGFDDFIDLINPLHHLPVVGAIYRELTGDEIKPAAQVMGGLLFGGPVGMVSAVSHAIAEEATGDSVTGHVVSALFGESDDETLAATPQPTDIEASATAANAAAPIAPAPAAPSPAAPETLAEIAPAAGDTAPPAMPTETTAEASASLSADTVSTDNLSAESPQTDAAPLEGAAALRAFLRDRNAVMDTAEATPVPEADPQAPVQKSDRIAGADGTAVAANTPKGNEASAIVVNPGRFMPVKPEHYNGRMAVRGPAGYTTDRADASTLAGGGSGSGEGPFATRMMEALKKYSALQDSGK